MPSETDGRVHVGFVKYLNTLPLVEGLDASRDLVLSSAVPSRLGAMLAAGEIDVGLVSLVDYATSAVPLALIPSGGIGCDGATLTVRLYAQVAPEQITVLHADTDSHTSVVLAQVVLAKLFGATVRVEPFDASSHADHWPEAVLMIGDKVVNDSPPAVRYPYQLDLGEQWKRLTGLPFVYAVWMCRAADAGEGWVANIASVLERQRLRNTLRTQWLVDRAVDERRWPRDLAVRYVTEYLKYEIGARQREGMERFFAEAGLGFTSPQGLVWVGDKWPNGKCGEGIGHQPLAISY